MCGTNGATKFQMMELNANQKIKTVHLNIQSLPAKFDKLKDLAIDLRENKIIFEFILLNETLLMDDISQHFIMPGYNLVNENRAIKFSRGFAIYILKKSSN